MSSQPKAALIAFHELPDGSLAVVDCVGNKRGQATSGADVLRLVREVLADDSLPSMEPSSPDQLMYEDMIRHGASLVERKIENRAPGAMGMIKMMLNVAKKNAHWFERDDDEIPRYRP